MGKKFYMLIAGLLLSVLLVAAWAIFSEREPTYHGKSLTFWLQSGSHAVEFYDDPSSTNDIKKADEALSQIGTNAVPFLLQKLSLKDSGLKTFLAALLRKQRLITIEVTTAEDRNRQAIYGFDDLESNAAFAVPRLKAIYAASPHPYSREAVTAIFGIIGPAAENAVPLLLQAANDTNILVRNNAIWALGRIHVQPTQVVPVLIGLLSDSNSYIRARAAGSLAEFGENAKPAVPVLHELLWAEQAKPKTNMTVDVEVEFSFDPGPVWIRGSYLAEVVTPVLKALHNLDR